MRPRSRDTREVDFKSALIRAGMGLRDFVTHVSNDSLDCKEEKTNLT